MESVTLGSLSLQDKMRAFGIITAVFLLIFGVHSALSLNNAQVQGIKTMFTDMFRNPTTRVLQPTIVRLAFHDCVGGKCDGCINLNNADNAGLETLIDVLESRYVGVYEDVISRADFWQLGAIVAIERGLRSSNRRCGSLLECCEMPNESGIVFKYGRVDCPTAPSTDEVYTFPAPTLNGDGMFDYFENNFNFTSNEVVALMAAHSLGRAQRQNSGYVGPWIQGATSEFNCMLHQHVINEAITKTNTQKDRRSRTDKKWQFDLTDPVSNQRLGMLLNTDVELAYDIDVNPITGTTGCDLNAGTCPKADTYELTATYAEDGTKLMEDFRKVYTKMIETGYPGALNDVQA